VRSSKMGSRSRLSRPIVSPQPPPPDRSGHHQKSAIAQRSSLEASIRNKLRMDERAFRLMKGIALILIVAVAIGALVSAVLALVGNENLS
jgi:hypothetical protein